MTTSILIITHNAPHYVAETLTTLNEITDRATRRESEIIVLDNASGEETKDLLAGLHKRGYIDKIRFSDENHFFSKGNNLAAQMADSSSRYLLLLNSDVRIKQSDWLGTLIEMKETEGYAAASYGCCRNPDRADGYCLLVDRELYLRHRMDENFPWWGGATKLQHQIMKDGGNILAFENHDHIIYHYGGKSGRDFKHADTSQDAYTQLMKNFGQTEGRVHIRSIGRNPGILYIVKKKCQKLVTLINRYR